MRKLKPIPEEVTVAITTYDLKQAFDLLGKTVVPSSSMVLVLKQRGFNENEITDALNDAVLAGVFCLDSNSRLSRA